MKAKRLMLMAILAIALVALAIGSYKLRDYRRESASQGKGFQRGDLLMEAVKERITEIARIEYAKNTTDTVVLARNETNAWMLESHHGYPADPEKINALVVELADAKAQARLANNPEKYETFGLKDSQGELGTLTIQDEAAKEIARLAIGATHSGSSQQPGGPRGGGRYVLVDQDPRVYLVAQEFYNLGTNVTDWAQRQIANIPSDQIIAVTIDHNTTETVTVDWRSGSAAVSDLAPDRKAKVTAMNPVRGMLASLEMTDVLPANTEKKAEWLPQTTVTATAKDGTVYTIQTWQDEEDTPYIALSAAYGEMFLTADDEATTESLEAAKKAAKDAEGAVDAFNEKHSPWIYEVASYTGDKFLKKRSDVTEPKPDEPAEEAQIPSPVAQPFDDLPLGIDTPTIAEDAVSTATIEAEANDAPTTASAQ